MTVFGQEIPKHEPTHADEQAMAVVAVVFDEVTTAVKRYVKKKDSSSEALRHLRTAQVCVINAIKEVGVG
jgi:hypothetical protein